MKKVIFYFALLFLCITIRANNIDLLISPLEPDSKTGDTNKVFFTAEDYRKMLDKLDRSDDVNIPKPRGMPSCSGKRSNYIYVCAVCGKETLYRQDDSVDFEHIENIRNLVKEIRNLGCDATLDESRLCRFCHPERFVIERRPVTVTLRSGVPCAAKAESADDSQYTIGVDAPFSPVFLSVNGGAMRLVHALDLQFIIAFLKSEPLTCNCCYSYLFYVRTKSRAKWLRELFLSTDDSTGKSEAELKALYLTPAKAHENAQRENQLKRNSEIVNMYRQKEANLYDIFMKHENKPPREVYDAIVEIGDIRSKIAIADFLDVIYFNPIRPDIKPPAGQFDVLSLTSPKIYDAGPNSHLKLLCPVFEALLRIGVSFPDSIAHMKNKTWLDEVFMLSCLAKMSGDEYFNVYFPNITNTWSSTSINLVSSIILKAEKSQIIPSREYHNVKEYDTWQNELITRFKSQLASGNNDITNTIATMSIIRSDRAMPLLIDNLTICPQVSTNAPGGFVFPTVEALISICPPLGICFEKLESTQPMSIEESLWLRITHEVYPEAVEYDLIKKSVNGDKRAIRLLESLPWRRLGNVPTAP